MDKLLPALSSVFVGALLVSLVVVMLLGCTGTRAAYTAGETLDAKAFVVTEHYAAVLREANELADRGAPRELVEKMQAADRAAAPVVLELREASALYTAARTAENAEQLQSALDAAALKVAAFVRALR